MDKIKAKLESGPRDETTFFISKKLVSPVRPNKMLNPYNIIPEENAPYITYFKDASLLYGFFFKYPARKNDIMDTISMAT